jgi:mRNA-degrading endonuclease YafQ of YafQ-DinJ toxin-antitoxin module
MIKSIKISSRFSRKFKFLSKEDRLAAVKEIRFFKEDPFSPSLNTHPLRGKFAGYYAFFVLPDLRIMFRFSKADKSEVILYDIGPHEIYK